MAAPGSGVDYMLQIASNPRWAVREIDIPHRSAARQQLGHLAVQPTFDAKPHAQHHVLHPKPGKSNKP